MVSTAGTVELADRVGPSLVDEVAKVVAEIRGLDFRREVPARVVDDAEARRHAVRRLETFYAEGYLDHLGAVYEVLGLVPEGTDVVEAYLDVLEEQAGGYYDPTRKVFLLLEDMPAGVAPVVVAHELTHALEDQHYDLDSRLEEALPNDDLLFARSAIHEGSATLLMTIYTARALAEGSVTPRDLDQAGRSEAARAEKLMALPAALRRPLLGTYMLGLGFLARGSAASGSPGRFPADLVDRAYRRGPTSSEQILHPEKYWNPDERDEPTPVELGEAGRVLGRRWERKATGVLGELLIGLLVDAPTPSDLGALSMTTARAWSNEASSGWDGCRWELWTRGRERRVVLLLTVWDGPGDAREFAEALPERDSLRWKREADQVAIGAGYPAKRLDAALDAMLGVERAGPTR